MISGLARRLKTGWAIAKSFEGNRNRKKIGVKRKEMRMRTEKQSKKKRLI